MAQAPITYEWKSEGLQKLEALIGQENVDKLTRAVAEAVRRAVIDATPVDTGRAKAGWTPVSRANGGWSFGNVVEYSQFLETGVQPGQRPWPSVGPKTVIAEGKIYSSQAPGGIYRNADVAGVIERVARQVFEELFK